MLRTMLFGLMSSQMPSQVDLGNVSGQFSAASSLYRKHLLFISGKTTKDSEGIRGFSSHYFTRSSCNLKQI